MTDDRRIPVSDKRRTGSGAAAAPASRSSASPKEATSVDEVVTPAEASSGTPPTPQGTEVTGGDDDGAAAGEFRSEASVRRPPERLDAERERGLSEATPPAVSSEPAGAAPPEHDYLDDLRRLQADFENYRKRTMKEQASIESRARARVVERLLPVLDNFERAISHGEGGEGVALVYKELVGALEQEGLEEIPSEGVAFDPNVHEAVEMVEDPEVTDTIVRSVFRRGYNLNGRMLRPAMVVVARAPDPEVGDGSA